MADEALYPEHEKQKAVLSDSQAIGNFIDSAGYTLCTWPEGQARPAPVHLSINQILAKYFEIDLEKIEAEKRTMISSLGHQEL